MTKTNTSDKTRRMVTLSVLIAITLFLGLTPFGYIRIGPFSLTLLCIPVIIGVIVEGLYAGLILGAIFGLTSLFQVFMGDPLGLFLFNISPLRTILMIFIPRLLVPVTAHFTHVLLQKSNKNVVKKSTYIITSIIGSMTNTFFFLGFLYVLFQPEAAQVSEALGTTADGLLLTLGGIVLSNGIAEAIFAAVIVSAVGLALYYTFGKKESVNDSNI
ncbi:MAG: ECF transporter S component [Clostridia bacterium]|nr:ECF transporter S component [Clostridia bacterium]